MFIIALVIATLIPALVFLAIHKLDLYQMGQFHYVLACAFSGAMAVFVATAINRGMIQAGLVSRLEMVRFTAPLVEELLKAAILFYLVRRPKFTYFVDGAIYGFAAGIGFAVFENWQYILGNQSEALGLAIGRVISTNLMHASASAVAGIALGKARFTRQISWVIGGLLIAILLHAVFNNLVTRINMGLVVIFAAVIGISSAIAITLIIKRGLAVEKTWIEETLGMADRVTAGEAAAVQRLGDLKKVLAPITAHFGPEKAPQIERMLILQAQLGIRRKTMEALTDEKMRQGVERQMDEDRREMEELRRSLGSYVMLYLRNIMPQETSPVWGRLETLLQERMNAHPTGGVNLWAALGERTASKEQPPSEE